MLDAEGLDVQVQFWLDAQFSCLNDPFKASLSEMAEGEELSMQENTKPTAKDVKQSESVIKVHEMAENMEHTLRRIVREKNKARAESEVQYLHK